MTTNNEEYLYARYDYAWRIPGWNSQINDIPDDRDVPLPPGGLRSVQILGEYLGPTGRPIEAVITIRPSVDLIRVGNKMVSLYPIKFRAKRGRIQEVAVLSPDVNNPCFPETWSYEITERVGTSTTKMTLHVPYTGTHIDMYDLRLLQEDGGNEELIDYVWVDGGDATTEVPE